MPGSPPCLARPDGVGGELQSKYKTRPQDMPKSMEIPNTRNKVTHLLLFSMSLFVVFSSSCYGDGLCTGKDETLVCLKKHSHELYSANHELFWKILNNAAKKANTCKTRRDTADFLSIVQITRDGELAEFFNQNIENLCVSNTKCFLEALMLLEPFDQDRIIYEGYNPIFKEPSDITEALSKFKTNSKYKRVIDLYMQRLKPSDNPKTK